MHILYTYTTYYTSVYYISTYCIALQHAAPADVQVSTYAIAQ
jgi:hypothetical protein